MCVCGCIFLQKLGWIWNWGILNLNATQKNRRWLTRQSQQLFTYIWCQEGRPENDPTMLGLSNCERCQSARRCPKIERLMIRKFHGVTMTTRHAWCVRLYIGHSDSRPSGDQRTGEKGTISECRTVGVYGVWCFKASVHVYHIAHGFFLDRYGAWQWCWCTHRLRAQTVYLYTADVYRMRLYQ